MRQSLAHQLSTINKIFSLLCIFFILTEISAASEGFYSVQTATYAPAALGYAKKHFNALYETFKDDDRNYLRIEQVDQYLVVRMGKFSSPEEAAGLLKKVKSFADDAFIVKADIDKTHAIKIYEKPSMPPDKGNRKAPEVISSYGSTVKTGPSPEEYYTLQIKNFPNFEQAKDEFNKLTIKMNESDLEDLRIEKLSGYFSLRVGKFKDYSSAKAMLARIGDIIPDAVIMKGKSSNEQTVSSYSKTSPPVVTIEQAGTSTKGRKQNAKNQGPEPEKQKKEVELLLKDVSNLYGSENYGKAAEILRKGIEKWPDNPDLHAWYGATLINMRYPENALQQYRKAVEISPDVPDYHAGVGLSLLNIYMDRAKESIDAFNKALQIDPDNVAALEGLGFVYASIGKKDLAAEMYNRLEPLDKAAANRLHQAIIQEVIWEER